MARDNPKAVKITQALTQFIALDDQPLSVVDNVGFRRLLNILDPRYEVPGRRYITETMLPNLHDFVKEHIHRLLCDMSAISLTTDIWSSSASPMALISLTAQWVDSEFKLQRVMLQAKQCRGSHTGRVIADTFNEMLQTWRITK